MRHQLSEYQMTIPVLSEELDEEGQASKVLNRMAKEAHDEAEKYAEQFHGA